MEITMKIQEENRLALVSLPPTTLCTMIGFNIINFLLNLKNKET